MHDHDAQTPARDIAFVFDNVRNYEQLVGAFRPGVEVHVLDSSRDGLAQIAAILDGRSEVGSLHIVSHGSDAALNLGALTLDTANVSSYADVLAKIGGALAAGGDILLYGCDIAADGAGASFVDQLARATGADVAASTNGTGSSALGGDWVLEYSVGPVTGAAALNTTAAQGVNTLLALPTAGTVNISDNDIAAINATVQIDGGWFTMKPTAQLVADPDPAVDGVYLIAGTQNESITVMANGFSSFDLNGMNWVKYFDGITWDGDYTFNITGFKFDGSPSVTTSFNTVDGSAAYTAGDYSQFKNLSGFKIQILTTSTGDKPSANTFDSFSIANPDNVPVFLSSTATVNVAQNSGAFNLASLLGVNDSDSGQTLTWSIQSNPANGAVSVGGATAASGTNVTPGGTFTYAPTAGYAGVDTFTVKVFDGYLTATKTFTVNVTPVAPSAPSLTASTDSGISTSDKITKLSSLTFSGTGAAGDSLSSVKVWIDKNGNGVFDAGTDISGTTVMTNGSWTSPGISVTGLSDGTYNVYAQSTSGGITSAPSAAGTFTLDRTAPTVTVTSNKSTLKIGGTATITFTFSEDPGTTFTWDNVTQTGDLTVTGGTLGALSGSGTTRTATFTPTTNTDNGSATITVLANTYQDVAGNNGSAGSTTISFDTKSPTLAISSDKSALIAGQTATITFTFSEDPGASFSWDGASGAVVVNGGTLSAISGSGTTRTAVFTPNANTNNGTASITVGGGAYTDLAGNPGAASLTPSISFDTKAPTVTVTSDKSTMGPGDTATITFTFSEDPGASFAWNDVSQTGGLTVNGGTLGPLSGSGTVRTATFTAGSAATASIAVTASRYTDLAGNPGAGATSPTILLDTTPPDAPLLLALQAGSNTGVNPADNYTKLATPAITGTAEAGSTVKLYEGATVVGSITADGSGNWTITTSSLSDGTHTLTATATDAAGNVSTASGPLVINVDTTAPTLTITSSAAALLVGQTATITFTFSEDPGATFTSGSITVSGGTLGALSGSGSLRTAVFTPAPNTDSSTASITVATGKYTDAAGNNGVAGATPSLSFDTKAPTVTISSDKSAMKVGDTAAITFHFSEDPGASFDASDLVVTGGSLGTISGSGLTRTATFTPTANTNVGSASIVVKDQSYSDAAGNAGSVGLSPFLTFDTLAPTVSITSDKSALKAGETANITFTFSEDPGTFTSGSVTVSGGALGPMSGTGTTRTAVFTPAANTNSGTGSISIAGGAYADAAGNAGGAGSTPSIHFDTLVPTVTITSDKAALKIGETATITFTFSEDPGSSFGWDGTVGTLAVSGGTLSATSGSGTTRTAVFTPNANTNGGTASIIIGEGSYSDAAGNAGHAGSTPSLVFDTLAPNPPAALALAVGSDTGTSSSDNLTKLATPTLAGTAEAGATVNLYDGAALVGTGTADVSGKWSIATNALAEGSHTITATATDAAGNTGAVSSAIEITIDKTAPTLVISSDKAALVAGQTATVTFTFSEDPGSTFASGDIVVSGGTLSALSGSGNQRTAVFTPTAGVNAGTASITVATGTYTDAAGNDGGAGTTPVIHFDTLVPTVTITSDKAALKIGETATITFTFGEDPGSSFGWDGTVGSLTVSGGTLSATSGSGTTRTAIFTPNANTNGGTASITVNEGSYSDAAGNAGHAGGTPSLVFDTLAPNAPSAPALAAGSDTGTSSSDNLTKLATPALTGTAEAGATVHLYDGATLVGTGTADGSGIWSIATSTLAEGSHTITATATDAAGNTGAASSALAFTIDKTAPTLTITSDKAALIAGQTATVTFTFSEDPGSTFASSDIAVTGGTLSAISGSGNQRTAVFTPTVGVNVGTASITVASGSYTDAAGNDGVAGTTPSIHFDTLVPTVTVTSDKAALKIGETATITFTFSEDPGSSFGWDGTVGSLTVNGGTLGATSGSGTTRTAIFTPNANTNGGTASITVNEGSYSDAAGNAGHSGSTPSLVFDTLAPSAPSAPALAVGSDTGTSSSDNLTRIDTPTLTGTAEAGATVNLYDGATLVGTGTADGSGIWSIATSALAEGSHSITAIATDAAGNAGVASSALAVTIDKTAPTLVITSDKAALIAGQTANLTFTFGEDPGSTFASGDIVVSGGSLSAISGSGNVRTAVFTPTAATNAGTASITVAVGTYTDAAGNNGGAGTTPSIHFDTLAPTVTIASDKGALKMGETATITFTFSEDPGATFSWDGSTGDVTVSGGTLSAITGSGATRTAVFTPTTGTNGGTASISIGAGTYSDAAGNGGAAGGTPSLVFDTKAPTLSITSDKAALIAGQTATVTFTFSEDPGSSFTSDDIVVSGGTLSAISGTGTVRTVVFTPTADLNSGTASITVAAGAYTDAAGNDGGAGAVPAIHFDTLVPTLTISSDKAALKIGETATITFTFSEDPGATFVNGDITVSGGTLGAISGSGTTRTAVFTPTAGINGGTASITVVEGSYADAAGNAGHAGSTPSLVFDTLAPNAPPAPVLAAASDSGASSSDNITNAQTLTFTGSAEDGAKVTLVDGTTNAVLGTATATGGVWSIDVAGLPEGVVKVAAYATDAAGNVGATSANLSVTVDRTAPGAPALALANGAPSGSTVNNGTVKVLNLDAGASWQYSLDHGAHWTAGSGDRFTLTANTGYAVTVRQLDAAGNISAASSEFKFNLDTARPTSSISISDTSLTSGETAIVTITFSRSVTGFDLGDIQASNATLSNLASTDGGRTWTATLTPKPGTVAGTNVVSVDNTGVFDLIGNAGVGSSSSPNYSVQTSGIGASISLSDTSLTAGEKALVTIRFSEPVHGFSVADLSVPNGTLSGLLSADGGLTWTATLTPGANVSDATNTITLDNSRLTGATGQHGQGVSASDNYSVMTMRVTGSIAVADHVLAPGASTAVTFKFSEPVGGFDAADISVTHASLSNLHSTDNGLTWTATLTADAGGKSAQPGAISVNLGGVHDAIGNTGLGQVASQFLIAPVNAAIGKVDGATVLTQTVTDPSGASQLLITIPEVTANRVDDPSSPNHGLADIPLVANPAGSTAPPVLTVSMPSGTSLQSSGSAAPLGLGSASTDLLGRIDSATTAGSSSQADLESHAQSFLAGLSTGTTVQTQTLVPMVSSDTPGSQPLVISGAQPGSAGPNAPVVAMVIDGSHLPAGTALQLDNVDFAAVTGNVRLFGGAGSNTVIGDGASQTIYLGPEDDVLDGGGGDDFIGSAGGNDILHGGDGNDLVVGGIGNDTLYGDAGDDMLNGGRSTVGDWSFHISAAGTISATHSKAVFTVSGSEAVQGSELDATVAELRFLKADPQKVAGIALLYAALDRVPDLAGLSYWATSGASLQDVAKGVLASAEFGGSALGQAGNVAFITGMYQHVLGRAPEQAALDYWSGRLNAGASRADVLVAVALSDEHKANATTADGIAIGQGSLQREAGWFTGSGDDVLDGGPGNDWLVGGDGVDTVVYGGNRAQYHFTIGADNAIHVLDTANGDLDTLFGIEAARFKDGTIDITVLQRDPAQLARVGLMYESVLHRPADLATLSSLTAQSMNAAQLAQAFTASADYQSKYAGMSDAAFVQALFANSSLDAGAAGGMQSWQDYLGHHTRAELIAAWIGQDAVLQAQSGAGGVWLL